MAAGSPTAPGSAAVRDQVRRSAANGAAHLPGDASRLPTLIRVCCGMRTRCAKRPPRVVSGSASARLPGSFAAMATVPEPAFGWNRQGYRPRPGAPASTNGRQVNMDQIGTTQAPMRGDGGGSEHRQCHHGPLKRIRCRTGWDLHRGRLPFDDDRDAHLGAANGGGTLKPSPASPPCGTHGRCCACSLAPASPPGCATTSTTTCPSCWAASARLPTAPKRAQRSTKSPCRRRTAGIVGHQEPASAWCQVILIRSNITSSAAIAGCDFLKGSGWSPAGQHSCSSTVRSADLPCAVWLLTAPLLIPIVFAICASDMSA